MFLTRISVNNPVFATMMMLALAVVGLFGYTRMSVDQLPDVDFPIVVVATQYPGASPETVESDVTKPVENVVNTVSGLDTLTSTSYQGRSVVIANFDLDTDPATALQDVRDKVSALQAGFRDEVGTPYISRFDPDSQPIMSVALRSDRLDLRQLTSLADNVVVKRLEVVPGVGQASLVGGVARQINILIDPAQMQALGIGIDEIMSAIRKENQDLPAGSIVSALSERIVQVEGRISDPQQFLDIIVARRGGQPVYLSQVASVEDGEAELESRALYDGEPALAIDIVKIQGANTIQVADDVKAAVAEMSAGAVGSQADLSILRDGSTPIRNSVADVQATLIEGAALAVAIVFLFLNSWRSTVITGLTLPVSVIGTFTVIYALGFTLNTMTLMALSLSIGILIDDAIVVRENITRHLLMGKSHFAAAMEGTKEIGLAVLATTLSIVAVFLPVAFMGGIIGKFFFEFGVTVSVAVLLSLFVSFTLDPMLSSVWYDPDSQPNAKRGFIGRGIAAFDRGFEHLADGYRHVIRWCLKWRFVTSAAAIAIFVGSLTLFPLIGAEFVPASDTGEFQLSVTTPVGSSLEYTTVKARQVVAALEEYPEVDSTYTTVNAGGATGKNKASISVKMTPIEERTRDPQDMAALLRERLKSIPGVTAWVGTAGIGGGAQKPIQISVLGDDMSVLKTQADEVVTALSEIPGAIDIESSLEEARPILAVRIRRQAASDLGVDLTQIADTLRPLVGGDDVTTWTAPDGNTYDVLVRLPENERTDVDALRNLMIAVPGQDGSRSMVRLDQIADVTNSEAASEIRRKDLSREVLISANSDGRPVGEITTPLMDQMAATPMPAGYRISFGGDAKSMEESLGYAVSAMGLAVIFIYFVLASQFGSFLQPLAIMMSLPLSLIGVFAGLLVTGSTLNIFSAIGFIMLMGLVVKNAILLVDYANQRVREGLDLNEALIDAGAVRLRPIVMTTLAMIFGMLPLALGTGEGGAQRAPMAHAVIGGLISSTLLTLVVVPVILTYLDQLGRFVSRFTPEAPDDLHHESGRPQPAE